MSDFTDEQEEPQGGGFINHIPHILWQRRWLIIPPFVLLSAAGVAVAVMLPTTYQSKATLLVQSQELPLAVVDTSGNAAVDQRIAKIRQQVLSRGDLIEVIERNDLYNEERRSKPLSEIVDTMREATSISPVAGAATGGQNGSNTVAFSMSFDYRNPVKAQAVMQSLVNRFLEIDTTNMEDQGANTLSFLEEQARNQQAQIAQIEGQITAIKARNGIALSSGMTMASDPGSYDAQVVQLRNQNRALALQTKRVTKDPLIAAAEGQLELARATYAENHPDVVQARARLETLRNSPSANTSAIEDRSLSAEAIQNQLDANNATIVALNQARAASSARQNASLAAQSRGPAIMEQVMQLDNRANLLRQQYQETSASLLKAQNFMRMSQQQKGERLSVVEPPSVPDEPISPNRPLLIAGGVAAGLGLGVVLALLLELVLRPVRGVGVIEGLGLEPLAVVPTLKPDRDPKTRKRSWFRRRRRDVAEPA